MSLSSLKFSFPSVAKWICFDSNSFKFVFKEHSFALSTVVSHGNAVACRKTFAVNVACILPFDPSIIDESSFTYL